MKTDRVELPTQREGRGTRREQKERGNETSYENKHLTRTLERQGSSA